MFPGNPLLRLFANLRMFGIYTSYLLLVSSNTSTSLMHPTPGKLIEDGITAYTLSTNSNRKLAFTEILTAFSLLMTIFVFLTLTLNPFDFQACSLLSASQ